MKTERRHELQTNVLADWLGRMIEKIKVHQNRIVTALGVALVVAAIVLVWRWRSGGRSTESWDRFAEASYSKAALTDLGKVADEFADMPAGVWARVILAKNQYDNGTQLLFQNKEEAMDELGRARDGFTKIREESSDPLLQQFATLSLARVYESLADVKNALSEYKKLSDNSLYAEFAKRQVARLESKSTQQFVAALSEFKPTPGLTNPDFLGPDKAPGKTGAAKTLGSLLDELDKISLPNDGDGKLPPNGDASKTEPAKTEPAKTTGG